MIGPFQATDLRSPIGRVLFQRSSRDSAPEKDVVSMVNRTDTGCVVSSAEGRPIFSSTADLKAGRRGLPSLYRAVSSNEPISIPRSSFMITSRSLPALRNSTSGPTTPNSDPLISTLNASDQGPVLPAASVPRTLMKATGTKGVGKRMLVAPSPAMTMSSKRMVVLSVHPEGLHNNGWTSIMTMPLDTSMVIRSNRI